MTPDLPYLPFARPEIDEDTIAAVSEVLRSGWITSEPQVQRFEQGSARLRLASAEASSTLEPSGSSRLRSESSRASR